MDEVGLLFIISTQNSSLVYMLINTLLTIMQNNLTDKLQNMLILDIITWLDSSVGVTKYWIIDYNVDSST